MTPKRTRLWATVIVALIIGVTVALYLTNQQQQADAESKTGQAAKPLQPPQEQPPATANPEAGPSPPPKSLVDTQNGRPQVREELFDDEHYREEMGVNATTAPSISLMFGLLDDLGTLHYDELKRPVNRRTPADRVLLSMELGALIAEGFLVVQCEKTDAIKDVGRSLLDYAKALSAGDRIGKHSQSLMEHSLTGKWDKLRRELSATQRDVEIEMILLQDAAAVHLVSLGGWVRAFEIATCSVANHYSEETSRCLRYYGIAKYYLESLDNLNPKLKGDTLVKALRQELAELLPLMSGADKKPLTLEQVKALRNKAAELSRLVSKA